MLRANLWCARTVERCTARASVLKSVYSGGGALVARRLLDDNQGGVMLNWAIALFVIAIIAAILGFGGLAGSAAAIAKIFFFVFLILAIASFAFGRRSI
jgi:uncharacterized membrane protein YtjA (UPF0391 family)